MVNSKTDLDRVCEALVASVNGLTPGLWLSTYGSISKQQLTGVRPQLRREYMETYRFYRAYLEDDGKRHA